MSYYVWDKDYSCDPKAIGSEVLINERPFTIIGVTPRSFFGDQLQNEPPDYWIPLVSEPLIDGAGSLLDRPDLYWLEAIGRLPDKARLHRVEAQLATALRLWLASGASMLDATTASEARSQTIELSAGGRGVQRLGMEYKPSLFVLLALCGLALVLVCISVAGLMLIRAQNDRVSSAIRVALGGTHYHLIGGWLLESVILSSAGNVVGCGVAVIEIRYMLRLAFASRYIPITASPSPSVFLLSVGISMITALACGIAPGWRASRVFPWESLKGSVRAATGSTMFTHKALVTLQAFVSLTILSVSGLLLHSFINARSQHFGFQAQDRYIVRIDPQAAGYQPPELYQLYREIREGIIGLPGVQSMSYSLYSPMANEWWSTSVYIAGGEALGADKRGTDYNRVGADYFSTLGARVRIGRPITQEDVAHSRRVAVVNGRFARKFFPGENPVGKHFGQISLRHAGDYEIVGLADDLQYVSPTSTMHAMFYLPESEHVEFERPKDIVVEKHSHYLGTLEILARGDIGGLEENTRRVLGQINPGLAVIEFHSLDSQVSEQFGRDVIIIELTSGSL
jgi:predicted permease